MGLSRCLFLCVVVLTAQPAWAGEAYNDQTGKKDLCSTFTDGIVTAAGCQPMTVTSLTDNGNGYTIGGGAGSGDITDVNAGTAIDVTDPTGPAPSVAWDSTEVTATTWGAGTTASNIWTFDLSGTDTTLTFGSALMSFSHAVTINGLTTANANLALRNGVSPAVLAIYEASGDGGNSATFQVPALAGDTDYTLPPDNGDAGEQLQTDGAGVLTWEAAGSGTGDSITVNSSAATNPDFLNGDIDWTLTGGNSITATVACTGCVDATDLATDAASADELNATGVESELEAVLDLNELQGQLTDTQLADGAVDGGTGGEIADGSVTAADLGTDSVAADEIAAAAVGTSEAAGLDIGDDTNLAAGRSLTLSGDSVEADAELFTDTKTLWFGTPTAADDFKTIWTAPLAVTITKISCESDQTVNFDLQVDDGTPAGVNGSDIACTTFATDASLAGDTTMAAGDRLDLATASVSGTPTWVSISWEFTRDD